jgi:predicted O-methyltransferase YrrM
MTSTRRPFDAQYIPRALAALIRETSEGVERIRERLAERRERLAGPVVYQPVSDWEQTLHELLAAPWPCETASAFPELWEETIAFLTKRGLGVGVGAFGGWDDADPALARSIYCLAVHLRPRRVVETGVARGLTSRFLLEGLEHNGEGELSSIDLPPLMDRRLEEEVGAAVPLRLRPRWTYIRGSSRRRLPDLLANLGTIDLFAHDSIHTGRNVLFELEHAWAALRPGGVAVVDDVQYSRGFSEFIDNHPGHHYLIGQSNSGRIIGFALKCSGPGRCEASLDTPLVDAGGRRND